MGVIQIPYGLEIQRGEIPAEIEVLEPKEVPVHADIGEIVRKALQRCSGEMSFQEFLSLPGELLIIVNDASRPTPTGRVLKELLENYDLACPQCIVAAGAHRGPTEAEYRYIFGDVLPYFRDRITIHDARNPDDMVYHGKTSRGTELYLNRKISEAQKILVIGSVEPHYFAGFTGGRKAFLPGVASFCSIEQNHKLVLEPGARCLVLAGNPVHEDMQEALRFIHAPVFSLQSVLDKHHQIFQICAGNITESLHEAARWAEKVYVRDTPEPADIVVTAAKFPMDVDFYQSQKALENARLAVKPGGVLILVSACREGAGESAFVELLSSAESPSGVLEKIRHQYRLGWHKAGKMAELTLTHHVFAVTPLPEALLEGVFITPFGCLQEALDNALKITGDNPRILVLPDGCVTVPRVISS